MKTSIKFFVAIILMITLTNCKKDKVTTPEPEPIPVLPTTGNLNLYFEGMVGLNPLVFSTQTYTNQAGNTYNVTMAKYYISNIKLTNTDNTVFVVNNSYHLIDLSDSLLSLIKLSGVPYGNYKAIQFMIGVDSTRNVSGAQTGALDPALGMFWTWSSGYIMAKMEGTSPQSTAPANKLEFHIGGFSGVNNVLKTVSPSFGLDSAKVSSTITPVIHLSSNLAEWFTAPTVIDFSLINSVTMPGMSAKNFSDNYMDMFTVEHIHN
jgi:hypothetical protein